MGFILSKSSSTSFSLSFSVRVDSGGGIPCARSGDGWIRDPSYARHLRDIRGHYPERVRPLPRSVGLPVAHRAGVPSVDRKGKQVHSICEGHWGHAKDAFTLPTPTPLGSPALFKEPHFHPLLFCFFFFFFFFLFSFTSFTEVQLMQVAYAYLDANALAWDDGGADCGNGASIVNVRKLCS